MGDLVDPPAEIEQTYEPRDAVGYAVKAATTTGFGGLLLAAVQNTVAKENIGAFGVFSRFGGTIALFAGMGGTYAFVSSASANLRQRQDPYNQFWGGAAAGALVGLRRRSAASTLGNGMALGVILAVVSYTGGSLFGSSSDITQDRLSLKEEIRKRFRRPLNETINEIGEGRGIYGPGYAERRAERIKQNYGIEVQRPYYEK